MRLVDRVRITPCEKSKIPAHVSAETGFYTRRSDGRRVAFQSSLERSFVQLCDFAREVQEIRWEPFSLLFDDLVDQQERRYTPDYLVATTTEIGDRFTYVIEVKPEAEIDRIWKGDPYGVDARRHVAMLAWCKEQPATEFVLVSEKLLTEKGLPNMLAVLDRAAFKVSNEVRTGLLESPSFSYPATLKQLVDHSAKLGVARGQLISSLLRLCGDDAIWFDVAKPIDDATTFDRGPRRRVFRR
jgi:hypothetical protein